jgi:hypothetical protein
MKTFTNHAGAFGSLLAVLLTAAFLVFPIGRLRATAQETKQPEARKSKSVADQIARGEYIVEGVAACSDCSHASPREW